LTDPDTASIGRRLQAFAIDGTLLGVVIFAMSFYIGFNQIGMLSREYWNLLLYVMLFGLAYMCLLPAIKGGTLGKLAIGLRIVRLDGTDIGFGRAFVRYVAFYLTGWFFFGILYLFIWVWLLRVGRRRGISGGTALAA
jgi:uncharacterized RDD family membrane protein YckC